MIYQFFILCIFASFLWSSQVPLYNESENTTKSTESSFLEVENLVFSTEESESKKKIEKDQEGCCSILHYAVETDNKELARRAIENELADVYAKDNEEITPLMVAISKTSGKEFREWFELFVEGAKNSSSWNELTTRMIQKASTSFLTKEEREALPLKIKEQVQSAAIKELVQSATSEGITPLHVAAALNNITAAKLLLEYGAHIETQDNAEVTPLLNAVVFGACKAAEYLLQNKADIHAKDKCGNTALHLAALRGDYEMTKLFIKANPHAKNKNDFTPLHCAALQLDKAKLKSHCLSCPVTPDHQKVAELLLKNGAKVNSAGEIDYIQGVSSLDLAWMKRDLEEEKLNVGKGCITAVEKANKMLETLLDFDMKIRKGESIQ